MDEISGARSDWAKNRVSASVKIGIKGAPASLAGIAACCFGVHSR